MQAMWSALHQVACKYSDRFGALFVNVEYLLIKPSEAMITLGWVLRFPGEFLICNVDEELNGVKRQITGDGWFDEKFLIIKGNDGVDEIRLSSETRHHMILLSKRMPTARIIVRETGIVVKWRPDGLDVQGLSALLESVLQLAVQLYAELASQASAEAPLRVHPELKPRREMLTALFNRADAPAWYQLVAPQPIERGQTGQVFAELGRRDERLRSRPLEPRGWLGEGSPWEARYDSASWGRLEPGVQVAMQELYDDGWRFSVQDGRTFLGIEDHWVWSEGFAPRLERACWIAWKLREHAA